MRFVGETVEVAKNGMEMVSDGTGQVTWEVCRLYIYVIYGVRRAGIISIVYEEDNFQEDNRIYVMRSKWK